MRKLIRSLYVFFLEGIKMCRSFILLRFSVPKVKKLFGYDRLYITK